MHKALSVLAALAFVACGPGDATETARPDASPDETPSEASPLVETTPVDSALRAPGPNSIVDYFNAHYGSDTARFSDTMQHLGFEVKDEANGYLRIVGAFEGWIDMVLWRKADGHDLVGVAEVACATVCSQAVTFYDYGEAGRRTVTDEVLPHEAVARHFAHMDSLYLAENPTAEAGEMVLWYELPRQGTSIAVAMNNDIVDLYIPIMELGWDRTRFAVKQTHDTLPPFP